MLLPRLNIFRIVGPDEYAGHGQELPPARGLSEAISIKPNLEWVGTTYGNIDNAIAFAASGACNVFHIQPSGPNWGSRWSENNEGVKGAANFINFIRQHLPDIAIVLDFKNQEERAQLLRTKVRDFSHYLYGFRDSSERFEFGI